MEREVITAVILMPMFWAATSTAMTTTNVLRLLRSMEKS